MRYTVWGSLAAGSVFAAVDLSRDGSRSVMREPLARVQTAVDETLAPFGVYQHLRTNYRDLMDYLYKPSSKKLLPDLPPPPPGYVNKPTLVVGMEGVLLATKYERGRGFRYQKRPYMDAFLADLSQYYEIVVFSGDSMMTVQQVVEKLDPHQFVFMFLFKDAGETVKEGVIKDLSNLNRDLSRLVMVDCDPVAFQRQPGNAVQVKWWTGDLGDNELADLSAFLKHVALSASRTGSDVRQYLQQMGGDSPGARLEAAHAFAEKRREAEAAAALDRQRQHERASKSIWGRK